MKRLLLSAALGFLALTAQAADIGVTAQEVHARVQQADATLLFVDVRDPVEIMFVGFTDAVHVNVPYLLVDRSVWDDQRGTYKIAQNPNFVADIRAELTRRGLDANTEIVTMCRSGSERGKPSADFLRANGFPNARYLIDGFQGSAIKEGPQTGFRLQNGWQNSGLPWSPKMTAEKMYRP
ncbi:rhodanese-like domain-containing protein [Pseudomonas sp.]|uniref:rhodanese-like domain-containing protein n=1 Tax=Pseudomonas sp. TaxID=306 RepID=UPI00299CFB36|nr:rhodanese-like domain-containing protein [Pseudomonas sp.]MDX1369723.1 rhodanese-like domain-containing protein [Pseudomonas sp.]